MDNSQNPWQTEQSQGNPYRASPQLHQQQPQPQSQPQPQQQQYSLQPQSQSWSNPNDTNMSSNNPWDSQPSSNFPSQQQQQQQYQAPPNPPPRRRDTDTAELLASQPDSGEQLEHMQNYEANRSMTQDDRNQADLLKQFPSIDSSLIAAIYNDHKEERGGMVDMASVRETLQELQT